MSLVHSCCLSSYNRPSSCLSHPPQILVPAELGSSTPSEQCSFLPCSPSPLPPMYKSFLHLRSVTALYSATWTCCHTPPPQGCELQNMQLLYLKKAILDNQKLSWPSLLSTAVSHGMSSTISLKKLKSILLTMRVIVLLQFLFSHSNTRDELRKPFFNILMNKCY